MNNWNFDSIIYLDTAKAESFYQSPITIHHSPATILQKSFIRIKMIFSNSKENFLDSNG